jgi:hypothetical protein
MWCTLWVIEHVQQKQLSCQALPALQEVPDAQRSAEAVRFCKEINMDMFEKVLCNRFFFAWRL